MLTRVTLADVPSSISDVSSDVSLEVLATSDQMKRSSTLNELHISLGVSVVGDVYDNEISQHKQNTPLHTADVALKGDMRTDCFFLNQSLVIYSKTFTLMKP